MDIKNFHPGRVTLVSGAQVVVPQEVELQIEGAWLHLREAGLTGDAQVRTIPCRLVERIDWEWPTGKP